MTSAAPRITTRVDEETQALLHEAASLSGGQSINAFVLSAAVDRAKQIMERERLLRLSREGTAKLFDALDRQAEAPAKLAKAVQNYRTQDSANFRRKESRKPAAKRSRRAAEPVETQES